MVNQFTLRFLSAIVVALIYLNEPLICCSTIIYATSSQSFSEIYIYNTESSDTIYITQIEAGLEPVIDDKYLLWSWSKGLYDYNNNSFNFHYLNIGYRPKIRENMITWIGHSQNNTNTIEVFNTTSNRTDVFYFPPNLNIIDFDIYVDIIIYVARYKVNLTSFLGRISLKNRTNAVIYVSEHHDYICDVSIFKEKVVFEGNKNGNQEIYLYNLSTMKLNVISNGDQKNSVQAILSENYILWGALDNETNILNCLYLYNIINNSTIKIIETQNSIIDYHLYERRIVYGIREPYQDKIKIYDIDLGASTNVTIEKSSKGRIGSLRIYNNLTLCEIVLSPPVNPHVDHGLFDLHFEEIIPLFIIIAGTIIISIITILIILRKRNRAFK